MKDNDGEHIMGFRRMLELGKGMFHGPRTQERTIRVLWYDKCWCSGAASFRRDKRSSCIAMQVVFNRTVPSYTRKDNGTHCRSFAAMLAAGLAESSQGCRRKRGGRTSSHDQRSAINPGLS